MDISITITNENKTIAERPCSYSGPVHLRLHCLPPEVGFYEKSDELLHGTS